MKSINERNDIICLYPQEEDLPAVLTVEEVRTILRIGRGAAYHLIHTGQLKRINVGGKFLIPRHELYRFLSNAV